MKSNNQLDELTMAFEDRWNVCNRRHHGCRHSHAHPAKKDDFLCSASAKAARREKRAADLARDRNTGR